MEKINKNLFKLIWILIALSFLILVSQYFVYTNQSHLEGHTKETKLAAYIAFTADSVGSEDVIPVKPFDKLMSSKKWLYVLKNNPDSNFEKLHDEWKRLIFSPIYAFVLYIFIGGFVMSLAEGKKK